MIDRMLAIASASLKVTRCVKGPPRLVRPLPGTTGWPDINISE
jgi:hypothetical protein